MITKGPLGPLITSLRVQVKPTLQWWGRGGPGGDCRATLLLGWGWSEWPGRCTRAGARECTWTWQE